MDYGGGDVNLSRRDPNEDLELIKKIGSGTYGEVYKARAIHNNEFCAIKIINIEQGDDLNIIKQEIQMMANLRHPNIIAYYNSYLRNGKLWISMEYCGGGSMQDIYSVSGGLLEDQICYVCRETLRGLQYLHERKMIHRDIKGANILITNNGYIKLADFGVSAKITATIAKRNSFIGTPYWMAPEVAAVEKKGGYNELCDIWAVGITAIELAETAPPHFQDHPMRILVKMTRSNYKSPTLTYKDKWSLNFNQFLKLALTKNPKKRPPAREMLEMPFFACLPYDMSTIGRDLLNRDKEQAQIKMLSTIEPNEHATLKINSRKEDDNNTLIHVPIVPPRKSKSLDKSEKPAHNVKSNTSITHGLPPTPKVHMGACFTKIFNGFPHKINYTAKWIHPDTKDVIILLASTVGVYALNLNEIAEGEMQLYFNKTTNWIYVFHNTMVSLSGKTSSLYLHDLIAIHDRHKMDTLNKKIHQKLISRRLSVKMTNTKGCVKCCVGRNPYNGYRYISAAFKSKILLFQWYDQFNKPVLIKDINATDFYPGNVFEMFITPNLEYPLICHGVHPIQSSTNVKFDIIDLNTEVNYISQDTNEDLLSVTQVMQLDRDIVLISYDNVIKIVNLAGRLKSNKRQLSYLKFNFKIDSIACLMDSVLAFHRSGMQGRSFKNDGVTQEITDESKIHEFFKMDRDILLDCRTKENINESDLFMLAGHENTI